MLIQRGYKYNELYDMTLYELSNTLIQVNKGLGYQMWKQSVLISSMFSKKAPSNPEDGSPELYPPKKRYKMPEWMIKKYIK